MSSAGQIVPRSSRRLATKHEKDEQKRRLDELRLERGKVLSRPELQDPAFRGKERGEARRREGGDADVTRAAVSMLMIKQTMCRR